MAASVPHRRRAAAAAAARLVVLVSLVAASTAAPAPVVDPTVWDAAPSVEYVNLLATGPAGDDYSSWASAAPACLSGGFSWDPAIGLSGTDPSNGSPYTPFGSAATRAARCWNDCTAAADLTSPELTVPSRGGQGIAATWYMDVRMTSVGTAVTLEAGLINNGADVSPPLLLMNSRAPALSAAYSVFPAASNAWQALGGSVNLDGGAPYKLRMRMQATVANPNNGDDFFFTRVFLGCAAPGNLALGTPSPAYAEAGSSGTVSVPVAASARTSDFPISLELTVGPCPAVPTPLVLTQNFSAGTSGNNVSAAFNIAYGPGADINTNDANLGSCPIKLAAFASTNCPSTPTLGSFVVSPVPKPVPTMDREMWGDRSDARARAAVEWRNSLSTGPSGDDFSAWQGHTAGGPLSCSDGTAAWADAPLARPLAADSPLGPFAALPARKMGVRNPCCQDAKLASPRMARRAPEAPVTPAVAVPPLTPAVIREQSYMMRFEMMWEPTPCLVGVPCAPGFGAAAVCAAPPSVEVSLVDSTGAVVGEPMVKMATEGPVPDASYSVFPREASGWATLAGKVPVPEGEEYGVQVAVRAAKTARVAMTSAFLGCSAPGNASVGAPSPASVERGASGNITVPVAASALAADFPISLELTVGPCPAAPMGYVVTQNFSAPTGGNYSAVSATLSVPYGPGAAIDTAAASGACPIKLVAYSATKCASTPVNGATRLSVTDAPPPSCNFTALAVPRQLPQPVSAVCAAKYRYRTNRTAVGAPIPGRYTFTVPARDSTGRAMNVTVTSVLTNRDMATCSCRRATKPYPDDCRCVPDATISPDGRSVSFTPQAILNTNTPAGRRFRVSVTATSFGGSCSGVIEVCYINYAAFPKSSCLDFRAAVPGGQVRTVSRDATACPA